MPETGKGTTIGSLILEKLGARPEEPLQQAPEIELLDPPAVHQRSATQGAFKGASRQERQDAKIAKIAKIAKKKK